MSLLLTKSSTVGLNPSLALGFKGYWTSLGKGLEKSISASVGSAPGIISISVELWPRENQGPHNPKLGLSQTQGQTKWHRIELLKHYPWENLPIFLEIASLSEMQLVRVPFTLETSPDQTYWCGVTEKKWVRLGGENLRIVWNSCNPNSFLTMGDGWEL